MRYFAMLLVTVALAGCSTTPATRERSPLPNATVNSPIEFLLTSCATDFQTHSPHPARFRDVRTGYIMSPDGKRQDMLCGEFSPAGEGGKVEWVPFITIKTSGYEQMLGDSAASLCKRSSVVWEKEDFSSSLQSRFDSLR